MAIREIRKAGSTYIIFNYRSGDRVVSIYCGKKGKKKTEKNIKKAKRKWYNTRLEKLKQKMSE